MKAVVISVNQSQAYRIFSGRQSMILRRSFPPEFGRAFRVYVYATRFKVAEHVAFEAEKDKGRFGMTVAQDGSLEYIVPGGARRLPMGQRLVGRFTCRGFGSLENARDSATFWGMAFKYGLETSDHAERYLKAPLRKVVSAYLWGIEGAELIPPQSFEETFPEAHLGDLSNFKVFEENGI